MAFFRSLIFVILYGSFYQSYGWFPQRSLSQSHFYRDLKLRCSESSDTNDGKRSRFNERLLSDAKLLREEALKLEKIEKDAVHALQIKSSDTSFSTNINTTATAIESKFIGEDFVGRFPIEKVVNNTNVFTMGAFASDKSTITEVNNGTYVSVLVERNADKQQKKQFLDQITGLTAKDAAKAAANVAAKEGKIPVNNMLKMNEIQVPTIEKAIPNSKIEEKEESESDKSISETPLSLTSIFKSSVSFLEATSLSLEDLLDKSSDGTYQFKNVNNLYNSIDDIWLYRPLLRILVYVFVYSDITQTSENKDDLKILEISAVSFINDVTRELSTEIANGNLNAKFPEFAKSIEDNSIFETFPQYFSSLSENFYNAVSTEILKKIFLRADYIKYKINKEIPSYDITEEAKGYILEFQLGQELLVQWRTATMQRLMNVNSGRVNEIIWDIKRVIQPIIEEEEAQTVPDIPQILEEKGEEKGILGILNAFLKKQVGATEIDLAEAMSLFQALNASSIDTGKEILDTPLVKSAMSEIMADQSTMDELKTKTSLDLFASMNATLAANSTSELTPLILSTEENTKAKKAQELSKMSPEEIARLNPDDLVDFFKAADFSEIFTGLSDMVVEDEGNTVYIHICIYIYICMYIFIYIYIYINIYIYI
jgi:hypothetical protein